MNWDFEISEERAVSVNDMDFTIVVEVFSTEVEMVEENPGGFWDLVHVPKFMCQVEIWDETDGGMEPYTCDISYSNGTERSSQINELVKHWLDKAEEHLLSNDNGR